MHTLLVKELLLGRVLQHLVSHKLLKDLTMINLFFNAIFDYESIDHDLSLLTDP
jgi:hypothetical protein